jgi:hypothetical protein
MTTLSQCHPYLCRALPPVPIPIPASTHTCEHGYGFHVGTGTGRGQMTHRLPVMTLSIQRQPLYHLVGSMSFGLFILYMFAHILHNAVYVLR